MFLSGESLGSLYEINHVNLHLISIFINIWTTFVLLLCVLCKWLNVTTMLHKTASCSKHLKEMKMQKWVLVKTLKSLKSLIVSVNINFCHSLSLANAQSVGTPFLGKFDYIPIYGRQHLSYFAIEFHVARIFLIFMRFLVDVCRRF